jgi:predicted DsbA family dithiol-disulfide isomerase
MAVENANITADTVECGEFPDLAEKYEVSGVPKIVVNETVEFLGAQPEPIFLKHVLKATA